MARSAQVATTRMIVRGVLSVPGPLAFFLVVERARWKAELRAAMGLAGVTAALLFALDNVMFIYSITHTSVPLPSVRKVVASTRIRRQLC